MKKKSNNFLRVIINQTKVVASNSIDSFTLKLKLMEQIIITDNEQPIISKKLINVVETP